MTKKACIIHTPAKKAEAAAVRDQLICDGYEVCLAEVTTEVARGVQAGSPASLSTGLAECLSNAEVCVILVDEEVNLGVLGGIASDGGCRVVTVGGAPQELPQEFDDIIDGHVPSPGSPELLDIANGSPALIRPDGGVEPRRKPKRVKCQ